MHSSGCFSACVVWEASGNLSPIETQAVAYRFQVGDEPFGVRG